MRFSNRYLIVFLCLTALQLQSTEAKADELPEKRCDECRNIYEHPEDARNFAMNQIFGSESQLGFESTRFRITDRFGNSVIADINAEYVLDPFDYKLIDDLMVKELVMQILLYFPNGDSKAYKFLRSLLDPVGYLPVPAILPGPTTPSPSDTTAEVSDDGAPGGLDDGWERWDDRDEYYSDMEEAWGGWVCRPDFSNPYITGVICKRG